MTVPASYEALVSVLKSLRERVMGINETVIATADGLLVAADTATAQPESVSALAAAGLGIGRRTAAEVGLGGLRDVVTRCAGGYVVVLAVGDNALLVILADEGLDLAGLYRSSPVAVEHLATLLAS
ncbi:roadblock/LC7 domain-containing protein [Actinacidiphila sp. ITFR-21]|uniref:roadblock/LC7 domain-containing protein n=1 Tax=Actinacidiphila sp. ITFR-21 TaxID=3075199 RepID=UPI0028890949|nr:roadblock/LC7 domain-containing protein [Streptomyces sp. ITFR-21]WNI14385.1 roadblock/LC7 domain-containing protein [Streptomyces sp. ITFR-21]